MLCIYSARAKWLSLWPHSFATAECSCSRLLQDYLLLAYSIRPPYLHILGLFECQSAHRASAARCCTGFRLLHSYFPAPLRASTSRNRRRGSSKELNKISQDRWTANCRRMTHDGKFVILVPFLFLLSKQLKCSPAYPTDKNSPSCITIGTAAQ
jgi:hypothetical protein